MSADTVEAAVLALADLMLQWSRAHVSADTAGAEELRNLFRLLQWSRAHVSADTGPARGIAPDDRDASMEPRSRERGYAEGAVSREWIDEASMEPRSRERGYVNPVPAVKVADPLQWSRAHVSADTRPPDLRCGGCEWLQWSRAHVSADTVIAMRWDIYRSQRLQWSRAHVSADTAAGRAGPRPERCASMEPRSRERGYHSGVVSSVS